MKKLIALSLLLMVMACKANESSAPQHESVSSVAAGGTGHAQKAPAAPVVPRMIVRTANVSVIVNDTSEAVREITKQSEAVGGYVADSRVWREGELLRATLTLRVPADKLTVALASIRTAAKRVESETVTSEDISQEFVDLSSRLRNLEATEVELRQLLTTVRQNAKRAADILEVHQQLTAIRTQIEQLRGRMRYLSQVSAMSSITLEVIPDAIAQPVVQPGWQPLAIVRNAGRALVITLQALATMAIWLVIVGGPLALLAWLAMRLRPRVRVRPQPD